MDIDKLSLNQRNILQLFDKEPNLSVGKIAKLLKIPHPTAKQSLNRLLEYKMIGRHGIGKGTFYHRIDENVIMDTLGNKLVTVYKGKEAFTELFNKIKEDLKTGDFYWSFAFKDEYYEPETKQFFVNFHAALAEKEVEDKTIAHFSVKKAVFEAYKNVPNIKIRLTRQSVPTGMTITKNMVVNLIWGEKPIAIAIFAPQLVKRYQEFFKSLWQEKRRMIR